MQNSMQKQHDMMWISLQKAVKLQRISQAICVKNRVKINAISHPIRVEFRLNLQPVLQGNQQCFCAENALKMLRN